MSHQKLVTFTITSAVALAGLVAASCSEESTPASTSTSSGGTSGNASSGGTSGNASSGGTSGNASSGGTSGNTSSGGEDGGADASDSGTSGGLSQKCTAYCTCMADPMKCGNTGFPGNCGEECTKNENGPWDIDCRIEHCGYGPAPDHCGHALGVALCQ